MNETHSAALTEWPDRGELQPIDTGLAHLAASRIVYAEQLAEAYKCRLELAMRALKSISDVEHDTDGDRARKALAAIGPLPNE